MQAPWKCVGDLRERLRREIDGLWYNVSNCENNEIYFERNMYEIGSWNYNTFSIVPPFCSSRIHESEAAKLGGYKTRNNLKRGFFWSINNYASDRKVWNHKYTVSYSFKLETFHRVEHIFQVMDILSIILSNVCR